MGYALPQEGQIVQIRGEHWAVAEIKAQGLPRSSADETVAGTQHAVTLSSLAEDRLGDELRVVWELEPGPQPQPQQDLPRHRSPRSASTTRTRLAAFIDALRWGAITDCRRETVQAPFRSPAPTSRPYQLEPLRRALQAPRANLLLADDVGLGKTIEAGLVIQELLLRHRARTVDHRLPAGLALKWQDEMQEKFGLDFTIVNSETMKRGPAIPRRPRQPVHAVPADHRLDGVAARPARAAAAAGRLRSPDPHGAARFAFDILVVDEAHHVAPSSPARTDKVGGSAGATPSTRSAPVRSATSPTVPSTGSSSPPRRTTATPSRSPRCWR